MLVVMGGVEASRVSPRDRMGAAALEYARTNTYLKHQVMVCLLWCGIHLWIGISAVTRLKYACIFALLLDSRTCCVSKVSRMCVADEIARVGTQDLMMLGTNPRRCAKFLINKLSDTVLAQLARGATLKVCLHG